MKNVSIPREHYNEMQDRLTCLESYGPQLTRCVGGRVVVKGYVCPHCDSSETYKECKSPKKESSQ